jgi:hypothetical protein
MNEMDSAGSLFSLSVPILPYISDQLEPLCIVVLIFSVSCFYFLYYSRASEERAVPGSY